MTFKKGDYVEHLELGKGTVHSVMPSGKVCVRFPAGVSDVTPEDLKPAYFDPRDTIPLDQTPWDKTETVASN